MSECDILVDQKSYDLAEYFLADEDLSATADGVGGTIMNREEIEMMLAQEIQRAVESWFDNDFKVLTGEDDEVPF